MGKKRIIQKSSAPEEATSNETVKAPAGGGRVDVAERGRVYVKASYNNTMVSLTDEVGNLIAQSSAGALGFKGPRKATPYAANRVVDALGDKMKKVGLKDVTIFVRGIGSGREAAVRALVGRGLNVMAIKDITPIPHNGPKPRKRRRV